MTGCVLHSLGRPVAAFRSTITTTTTTIRTSGLTLLNIAAQTIPLGKKNKSLRGVGTKWEDDLLKQRLMKRLNNLFKQICSIDNLMLADAIAQQGKSKKREVKKHNENSIINIERLHRSLIDKTFTTSAYSSFKINEGKEREVFQLPYYPDGILQQAILNVIEPILVAYFTTDTYAGIKGRGVHQAAGRIREALKDKQRTKFCLQLDIRKFYPSINHDILKGQLRRKFKDEDLLWLLDNIIDSAPGLPIGYRLSQSFSTVYLTGFDHWIKEVKKIGNYFRYVDDVAIFSSDKQHLHALRVEICEYLEGKLNLQLKSNWQVYPIDKRALDMLGYRFFRDYTLLRKRNKQAFARAVAKGKSRQCIAGHLGWAKHCNSRNLVKKLLPDEPF